MTMAVELKGVEVRVPGKTILEDVDLQIKQGQHWVLLGPNGAGKTTVAKLIAGREFPSEGTATVLGQDTRTGDSSYLASRIGFASADVRDRLASNETVLSLVLPAAWGQTVRFTEEYEAQDEERARDLLAALGIGELADRRFGTLSEGERQTVTIARALMADPEIVILDEPTAGLDLGARETLVAALRDLMADPATPTVVMITHEIEEIAPGFTHAALLKGGRVTAADEIQKVLTGQGLSDTFGLPLQVEQKDERWWARAI